MKFSSLIIASASLRSTLSVSRRRNVSILTAAFIAFQNHIKRKMDVPQVIILGPTTESVLIAEKNFSALGTYFNISWRTFVEGNDMEEDIVKIENGQRVIFGTPDRIYDLLGPYALAPNVLPSPYGEFTKLWCLFIISGIYFFEFQQESQWH